jgi:hypothetical protein
MALNTLQATPQYATASWALAVVALEAALAQYGPPAYSGTFEIPPHAQARLNLSSTAVTKEPVPACEALGSALEVSIKDLKALTIDARLGLVNVGPDSYPGWQPPRSADAFLNLAVRCLRLACATFPGCKLFVCRVNRHIRRS